MLVVGKNFDRHTAKFSARFQHDFVRLFPSKYVHPLIQPSLCLVLPIISARSSSRPTPCTESSFKTNIINIQYSRTRVDAEGDEVGYRDLPTIHTVGIEP
jgi:hypothetical protein